jgi:Domain of unknown function (DUF4198)
MPVGITGSMGGVVAMRFLLTLAVLALLAPLAQAHYNMLIPSVPFATRDKSISLAYQWGHPFEHQLFDAPAPKSLVVRTPDGKTAELTDKLVKVALPGDKGAKVVGYRLTYTPTQRGDHVFVLHTPPIWLDGDEHWVEDTVKVVLHVETERGWNSATGEFEWIPITRPYGLLPGAVFQANPVENRPRRSPLSGTAEVERYNATPPGVLPAEEFITRTMKVIDGVATTTLPEAGWWALTLPLDEERTRSRGGKDYPLIRRTTLWVYVHDKAPSR